MVADPLSSLGIVVVCAGLEVKRGGGESSIDA